MPPSERVGSFTPFLIIQGTENQIDYVEKAHVADFETAVHYAGFGKFQKILLAVCGTIYATCAISTTTLSFVLPSAECDFHLTSADKGKLSAMPLIGMIFGCTIWGSIADSQGRKMAIMLSLLVDFLAAVASSTVNSFQLFLACRFFNGFGIIGATSIIFSYLGEFLSIKHRDTVLGRLEVFWNVGIIILPGVAWSLLNRSLLEFFADHGNFSPWRIFVLVCSLPSLISLVMLYFLPETPKFLMSKEKYDKARMVFQRIYTCNTGQSMCLYPVLTLEGEYENNNNIKFVNKMPLMHRIAEQCKSARSLLTELFSQPYIKFLGITSFADFGLMASYYTLIMWFPEIFDRFSDYELRHPNRTASVCEVSQHAGKHQSIFYVAPCDPSIDNRVFIDTIIIGLSCIPTSVSLSYFMKKIGKKAVLVISLILSGLSALALNWVKNTTQTLVLSCVFEALTSILEAVLFCVVVDLFPTNLRAIALAITATSGRLGAIFGNVIFGLLIDLNCIVPIHLFGFLLIEIRLIKTFITKSGHTWNINQAANKSYLTPTSGCLCLGIPRNENYIVLH